MTRFWRAAVVAASVCAGTLVQGSAAAWADDGRLGDPMVMERSLPAAGTVVLDMNVGDLKIVSSAQADHLRLEVRADREYDEKTITSWVKRFDVAAGRASLDISLPSHNHCNNCDSPHVTLYVPAKTDLKVKLDVGDMNIEGIRGNKEVQVRIGDLHIGYQDPNEYAHVETTTHIGDVEDPLHSGDHGFLGKSEDFTRQGEYHLRASVWIGDLCLFEEGKS